MKIYEDFLKALGFEESSGYYYKVNPSGYIGKYQVGEGIMEDLGYYLRDKTGWTKNDWIGELTGKNGIYSKNDFLNNPKVQEIVIREEMDLLNRRLRTNDLNKYIGKTVMGVEITKSGLLAGAHIAGAYDLKDKFFDKGIDKIDGNGTKISSYVRRLGGYKTPFEGKQSGYLYGMLNVTPVKSVWLRMVKFLNMEKMRNLPYIQIVNVPWKTLSFRVTKNIILFMNIIYLLINVMLFLKNRFMLGLR